MDGDVSLTFQPAFPPVMLVALALLMLLFIFRAYRRGGLLKENPRLGYALLGLKVLALLGLLIMLLKPQWTRQIEKREKSDLIVLLDYSESMNIRDEARDQTRFDAARKLLLEDLYPEVESKFQVKLYEFSSFLRPVSADDITAQQMADGSATDIGGSIDQAIKSQQGHEAGAVVVYSDGVHNTGKHPDDMINQLAGQQIPVFTVGLGGQQEYQDVELNEVIIPELVFEKETTTIGIDLTAYGFEDQMATVLIRRTGIADLGRRLTSSQVKTEEIARKEIKLIGEGFRQRVELTYQPQIIGDHYLNIEVTPLEGESIEANNRSKEILSVVKRKLRVLIIEGPPRWGTGMGFRALRADPRFQVDSLTQVSSLPEGMLPIGPGFTEEEGWGENAYARITPLDPPFEWYDCVLLGDINPARFKPGSLDRLASQVKVGGLALIFQAGPDTYGKGGWDKTPLGELLPVTLISKPVYLQVPTRFKPTAAGLVHPLVDMMRKPIHSEQLWEALPEGFGFYRTERAKPGAMILAEHPSEMNQYGKLPLMVFQRTGKGRVVGMFFDQHWLWSMTPDEEVARQEVFSKFWRGLVRFLVSGRSEENLKGIHLQLEKDQLARGESLEIRARAYGLESMEAVRVVFELTGPDGLAEEFRAATEPSPNPDAGAFFVGQIRPEQVGEYNLAARLMQGQEMLAEDRTIFNVETAAFEHRNAGRNTALLKNLSQKTQGKFYEYGSAGSLAEDLPPSQRTIIQTKKMDLWNSLAIFILVVAAMNAEWVIRKWKDLS